MAVTLMRPEIVSTARVAATEALHSWVTSRMFRLG